MGIKDFEPRVVTRCGFCDAQDVCLLVSWREEARRALEQQAMDPRKSLRKKLIYRQMMSCGGLAIAEAEPDNSNSPQTKPGA